MIRRIYKDNWREDYNMNLKMLYSLLAVVAVLSALNLFLVTSGNQSATAAAINAKEDSRPANIEIIKLSDPNCADCFSIDKVLSDLKSKNVKVLSEDSVNQFSENGKGLTSKFGITKLPTLIVSGEVKKSSIENLWKGKWELKSVSGKDYYVYTDLAPPYFDLGKNRVVGRVSLTNIVDSSCKECTNLLQISGFLKQNSVSISEEKTLEYNTPEAKELINKFGVERIPAIILSNNILEYPSVKQVWAQLNATERGGFFALHAQAPPYKNAKTGELNGLVDVIYLVDSLCKNCYNVTDNREIIDFHSTIGKEKTVDIGSDEGQSLIKKYKIEKVPIVLMSPDAGEYQRLKAGWTAEAGTIESDGWFVMRNPDILGNYKDLVTGSEVVIKKQRPPSQAPSSAGHG